MKIFSCFTALIFIFCVTNIHAQYHKINGYVFNDNDEPLIGASIFLRDTRLATLSDDRGYFEIDSVDAGLHSLVCTHLGYKRFLEYLDVYEDIEIDILLEGFSYDLEAVQITTNRLEDQAPFPHKTIDDSELEDMNLGQDIPFLVQFTPSVVATSDAGAGIGYTGMRIRGSDPTRVNVTINGIPLNDAESQTVFWVDLPDFSSSLADLQIQRGVGTSTNGTGAFGGTMALNTHKIYQNNYAEVNLGYGSFNTQKMNVKLGTGLLNSSLFIDGRFSLIKSNGYIDRATSDLSSWYLSVGRISNTSTIRFDYFSGQEDTYQAWWGVPESKFEGDDQALQDHFERNKFGIYSRAQDSTNLFDSDERYNYYLYENQVDNYQQDHYQFHWGSTPSDYFQSNISLHYTRGLGFFEQFETDQELSEYGLNGVTDTLTDEVILVTDLVRRKWLDNHFFGAVGNFKWEFENNFKLHYGLAGHYYTGDHFGNIVSWDINEKVDQGRRYYSNEGKKTDLNSFFKLEYALNKLSLFGDIQYRFVNYNVEGRDDDNVRHNINSNMNFINPKAGLTYMLDDQTQVYGSFAVGNREPDRNDFLSQPEGQLPKHETLFDYELGFRSEREKWDAAVNLYLMDYQDQLVITGELNNVGANLRTNVPDSYRRGIEIELGLKPFDKLKLQANTTLSQNKIERFEEIIYNYDNGEVLTNVHENTDITLSPNVIGAGQISYRLLDGFEVAWQTKYVGKQFLDNTSNDARSLDPYLINNLLMHYEVKVGNFDHIRINAQINNILNEKFASNGYTYSYVFQEFITENFVYPQAGLNFLLGLSVKI